MDQVVMYIGSVLSVYAFVSAFVYLTLYFKVRKGNNKTRILRRRMKARSNLKPGEWEFRNEADNLMMMTLSLILLFLGLLLFFEGYASVYLLPK